MEICSLLLLKYFQRTYSLVRLFWGKKPAFNMSPLEFIRISKSFVFLVIGWLLELIKTLFVIFFGGEGRGGLFW